MGNLGVEMLVWATGSQTARHKQEGMLRITVLEILSILATMGY